MPFSLSNDSFAIKGWCDKGLQKGDRSYVANCSLFITVEVEQEQGSQDIMPKPITAWLPRSHNKAIIKNKDYSGSYVSIIGYIKPLATKSGFPFYVLIAKDIQIIHAPRSSSMVALKEVPDSVVSKVANDGKKE
jgi:hypothetical protein